MIYALISQNYVALKEYEKASSNAQKSYRLNKKNPKYVYSINRNKLLRLLNIMPQKLQNKIIKKILLPPKN